MHAVLFETRKLISECVHAAHSSIYLLYVRPHAYIPPALWLWCVLPEVISQQPQDIRWTY
jgi:hypothetical protein